MAGKTKSEPQRSLLEQGLGLITEVRAGEGVSALLLTLNIFLLLLAYYLIKPVREALILEIGEDGAQYKAYMGGAIAVGLLVAVPAYSAFAQRVARNRLVISITLFFASHLVLWYIATFFGSGSMVMGLGFYLWVGIFNMMVIAQAWAFAADIYTNEQGKRIFALIGVGASVGAVAGSAISATLTEVIGTNRMLLLAGALLCVIAFLTQVIHVRESGDEEPVEEKEEKKKEPVDEDKDRGAFEMVFKHKYLMLLAAFSVVFTLVNSTGEYMLSEMVGHLEVPEGTDRGDFIGAFYGQFFFWVNLVGAILQLFVVSRLVKYTGLTTTFLILPCIALLGAGVIALFPIIGILRVGKIAENSVDYSINNTVRNMLWLPTTREMKYRAKQAVDTFFIRMGDVGAALVVLVLAGGLHLGVRWFAVANLVVIVAWFWVAILILRERETLVKAKEAREKTATGTPEEE